MGRVEVLRGPQGTLFGKNASAGVINVTTNAPDPRKFEAMGHLDMGLEYNEHLGQAMLNLPLTANSALRLSAGQSYVHDLIYNNVRHDPSLNEINGFRARYQWKPLPDLSINIVGDYEKAKVSEQPYIIFSRYNNAKTGQPEAIPGCGNAHVSYSSRLSCNEDPSYAYTGAWGLSGQIEWTVFDQTITSITAGRRYTQDAVLDVDGLPSQFYDNSASFDNKVLSQELRIASPSGVPLEYTAGFYWSKSNVPSFQGALIGADLLASAGSGTVPVSPCTDLNICAGGLLGLNNPNNYVANLTSSALFGQLTWHALDNFRVVAGARLTRDNVNMNSQSYLGVSSTLGPELVKLVPSLAPLIDGVVNGLIPYGKSLDSNEVVKNFSWHSALQYNFTKDLMVFASVTHGYKGPQIVFNPPNLVPSVGGGKVTLPGPPSISIVQPESPMDEEAGVKATVLDGHLAVDFNLFHTIIKDFQAESFKAQGFVPANVSHDHPGRRAGRVRLHHQRPDGARRRLLRSRHLSAWLPGRLLPGGTAVRQHLGQRGRGRHPAHRLAPLQGHHHAAVRVRHHAVVGRLRQLRRRLQDRRPLRGFHRQPRPHRLPHRGRRAPGRARSGRQMDRGGVRPQPVQRLQPGFPVLALPAGRRHRAGRGYGGAGHLHGVLPLHRLFGGRAVLIKAFDA